MSILIDQEEWRNNPWFKTHGPEHSDYTGFYVGISICSILAVVIIALNLVLCCCSPHKDYWRDPHTGNRLLFPVWISGPKRQPPLTLMPELASVRVQ